MGTQIDSNTSELWDQFWVKETSPLEDQFYLKKEELGIRWQRIEKIVLKEFGSFEGLKIIEIGSGTGTISGLMKQRGAEITLLDYSPIALERAEAFFKRNGMEVDSLQMNALELTPEVLNQYDVSISLGLTEHFKGPDREAINKAHLDVLKPGGITFISVPNKFNPPYRIFKFLAEVTGKWSVGEEYPYSRNEFREMMERLSIKNYSFLGDSFWGSFFLVNPFRIGKKLLRIEPSFEVQKIRKQKGSWLDEYISYALILFAKKPQ